MTANTSPARHGSPTRLPPLWEGRSLLLGTGIIITLLASLLVLFPPLMLQRAGLMVYDQLLRGRPAPPPSHLPVLITIDEQSLATYGQWPWPRHRMAELVERLQALGAKVVAVDFLMPEADRTAPELVAADHRHSPDTLPAAAAPRSDSNSRRLAQALAGGASVLGCYFDFTGEQNGRPDDLPAVPEGLVISGSAGSSRGWQQPFGVIRSIPMLAEAAQAEGFTNALHDRDGVLRRVPLLITYRHQLYPSLSLAALLLTFPDRAITLTRQHDEALLTWNGRSIPLDTHGNLLIGFRDQQAQVSRFSARDILGNAVPVEAVRGRIALIGPWAKGLGDLHLVPSGKSLHGLAIHATIIDTILSGHFIHRPGWTTGAELCMVLLFGFTGTWLFSRPGFLLSLVTVTAASLLAYLGAQLLLRTLGLYLNPLLPMLTPLAVMTALSLLKYGIEAHKLRRRTLDLIEAQDTIIVSMSALTETRDKETGGHILRTQKYVELLARHLAKFPQYRHLDEDTIELLTKSAPLHDIGKVGVADSILLKHGQLTGNEYETMKTHTLIGADALAKAIGATGHPEQHAFLHYAREMIESHHERWDGSGYPHGLRGEKIPLAGRLMALADVYDALRSKRIYKDPFSHETAMEMILRESGRGFDPDVVAAFVTLNQEFNDIHSNSNCEMLAEDTPVSTSRDQ